MKLTRKDLEQSPALQREYGDWLKHPFTEKAIQIIESDRDELPIFPSPEHMNEMYACTKLGNFGGIVWTLKRLLSLMQKPEEIVLPEATYEAETTARRKK